MGIVDLFHKRAEKARRAGQADVYQYDDLPAALRRQVVMILAATLGPVDLGSYARQGPNAEIWGSLDEALCRELGVFTLATGSYADERISNYLLNAPVAETLSVIELAFQVIDQCRDQISGWQHGVIHSAVSQEPQDAIDELNHRFREHRCGYQYESGEIFRLDDDFTHSEIVRPALAVLGDPALTAADEHFRQAHKHYRAGESAQAMGEALKALESTLKVVCQQRGWTGAANATAKPLLDLIFEKGLLPSAQESYMAGVRVQLESGLPTTANPNRHGQVTSTNPPDYLVAFALRQAATSISLIVEAHRAGSKTAKR